MGKRAKMSKAERQAGIAARMAGRAAEQENKEAIIQEVAASEAAEHEQFEAASEVDKMPSAEEIAELEAKNDAALDAEEAAVAEEHIAESNEMDAELKAIEEVEEDNKQNNSVVAAKFKDKYLAAARAAGIPGKAAKRSNWDWLSQQIAMVCLDEKHKIRIADFTALLDANGVDHSRWTNRNKGWEGRFRMTGRVALQKIVADNGVLKVGDSELPAPAEFINRFKTKE